MTTTLQTPCLALAPAAPSAPAATPVTSALSEMRTPALALAPAENAASRLAFAVGQASKTGPRPKNDDFAGFNSRGTAFAISDGIGGAPHGNVASTVAVNVALAALEREDDLGAAFAEANHATIQLCEWLKSPGTGATLLLATCEFAPQETILHLAWVGDSTALLLRDGTLTRLTPPDRHEGSHALRSAVGYQPDMEPKRTAIPLRARDRLLLCTDGVWETLEDARLTSLLGEGDNAPWIAELIAREAADCGNDNATALVLLAYEDNAADVEDSPSAPAPVAPCTPVFPSSTY